MSKLRDWLEPLLERQAVAMENLSPLVVNNCVCHTNNDNGHTTEPIPPVEEPADDTLIVTVAKGKIALYEVKNYNDAGYPRMGILGKTVAERYRFVAGDKVVVGDKVRADGGVQYYQVLLGQDDAFGKDIPEEPVLYLPSFAL